MQEIQARRNEASKEIGKAKREGRDADALMAEVAGLKDRIQQTEEEERATGATTSARRASLPLRRAATVANIEWEALRPAEARRLRELGFDAGVSIEALHVGPIGRDPIACRVGRMTIALRRVLAASIHVELRAA